VLALGTPRPASTSLKSIRGSSSNFQPGNQPRMEDHTRNQSRGFHSVVNRMSLHPPAGGPILQPVVPLCRAKYEHRPLESRRLYSWEKSEDGQVLWTGFQRPIFGF